MMASEVDQYWEAANWPAASEVRAGTSLRRPGLGELPYRGLNLALHVGDIAQHVEANRLRLGDTLNLPDRPVWLNQIHSNYWLNIDHQPHDMSADASYSKIPGTVCAVLTADCVPILIYCPVTRSIAAVHAGWRGIARGILSPIQQVFPETPHVYAWIGPCISSTHYEVGSDVYLSCHQLCTDSESAFQQVDDAHWHCDLVKLVTSLLRSYGVTHIYPSQHCSYTESHDFYSYRRDGKTGRNASLIWIE